MLIRHLPIAGAAFLFASSGALAAPAVAPILFKAIECAKAAQHIDQVSCNIIAVEGDRNDVDTKQVTVYSGHGKSLQLGITYVDGNDNRSHHQQIGEDQVAVTVQKGNDNSSSISQKGEDQLSATVQVGDDHSAASAIKGDGGHVIIVQTN